MRAGAVTVGVFALFSGAAFAGDCPTAGTDPIIVAAAIDGATLRLADGSEIRLAGIEAPARPLGLAAAAPWPIGDQARARLAALTGTGAITVAWAAADPDRYGRRHTYVFADGAPVAQTLLGEGLARAHEYPGEAACFPAFLDAEAPALAVRRGLWALSQFQPRNADDPSLADENGLYAVVEGRIDSVGHGTSMTFLDFGRNFRRDFTVMVPQELASELTAPGTALDKLTGKRVSVRGVIEVSGGPAIVLDDANALVVTDGAGGSGVGN